jgi:tRNA pseudouridine55 synthase
MDGLLLVDKPAGITSAEVVRRIKMRVRPVRVGHLGTLDPFATGLLPILLGEATKLAPFLQNAEKEYAGTISLGIETDTLDPTGVAIRTAAVPALNDAPIAEMAGRFTGKLVQTPPLFSAIKRAGVPLYKLARRGEQAEPPPREVEILSLQLKVLDEASLQFVVTCSTGTYVRSLARDIGLALGTVAHLAALRRMRSGGFSLGSARSLTEVLDALGEPHASSMLIGLRDALATLAEAEAEPEAARRLRHGDSRALDGMVPADSKLFKVVSDGALIAVAEATSRVTARVVRVFGA